MDSRSTLSSLWSPIMAVTTCVGDRTNGQIAVAGLSAGVLPEAPRVLLELWKSNLTHDLVLASGVFALHLLPEAPDSALETSLSLVRLLGLRSGRDGDKMASLEWQPGITGSPILASALSYVEGRVIATLDCDELTVYVADVVAGERLREGEPLSLPGLHRKAPPDLLDAWRMNRAEQVDAARVRRGPKPK
jgi:flavin reductase (DIM6/NTAB) family NADH-FMN oxidoreductase RutF